MWAEFVSIIICLERDLKEAKKYWPFEHVCREKIIETRLNGCFSGDHKIIQRIKCKLECISSVIRSNDTNEPTNV